MSNTKTDNDDENVWSTIVPGTAQSNRGDIRRPWNAETVDPVCTLDGCRTLYETFRRGCALNPLGPCMGFRAVSSHTGFATPYIYSCYTECLARVNALAAGLDALDLMPVTPNERPSRLLAFYMGNCVEWVLAQHAAYSLGGAIVPLYDTLGTDTVAYCLTQTAVHTVVCTRAQLKALCQVKSGPNPPPNFTTAVVVNGITSNAANQAEQAGLQVISLAKVEAVGAQRLAQQRGHKHQPPSSGDVAFILYTSGTTGNPKGAVLTHENLLAAVGGANQVLGLSLTVADRHLSYLPLAHIFEHLLQTHILCAGGSIAFYRCDPLLLFEDVQACRPTIFIAVPRVLNKLHDKIQSGFAAAGGIKKRLFDAGLAAKITAIKTQGSLTHGIYDLLIFNKIKKAIGLDQLRVMISGAAPLSSQVMMCFRCLLGVPVLEGYGQTEGSGCATVSHPDDVSTAGHVGGPSGPCEVCLVDVPEMGYFHTDTQHQGQPVFGRGEIWVRGRNVFEGYYKDPVHTAEALSKDGWLQTGDVGCWRLQGGLQIIDRKKNIFKLAQGEYVAPEKVENILQQSPLIAQVFVHGDSLQTCLVGVVVPDEEPVMQWAKEQQHQESSFSELCKNSTALKQAIVRDIRRLSKQNGLAGFELVTAVFIEPAPFSVENGILTPTFKLKRKAAREHYEAEIEKLYQEIAAAPVQSKL